MKKIAIFGCKSTTLFILEAVAEIHKVSQLITIDSRLGFRNKVADYLDLKEIAEAKGISTYQAQSYGLTNAEDLANIRKMKIDLAFVMGWQRLIPNEILKKVGIGVFGMHGSSMDLPLGRGRSPMNWSILEDRKCFYTNLFKYDPGIDSGDILDTYKFTIRAEDTAETMHFKNSLAMKHLISRNLHKLLANNFKLKKQKKVTPTYYPKRNPTDSLIDWQRDISYIERHIRAVAKPFNGAYTFLDSAKVIIHRAAIFEAESVDYGFRDESVAKVIEVFPNGKFLIKCNGGILLVHEFETPAAISAGCVFGNGLQSIRYFEINKFGNYDL